MEDWIRIDSFYDGMTNREVIEDVIRHEGFDEDGHNFRAGDEVCGVEFECENEDGLTRGYVGTSLDDVSKRVPGFNGTDRLDMPPLTVWSMHHVAWTYHDIDDNNMLYIKIISRNPDYRHQVVGD